ncbi:MAG: protein GlmU [Desulfobacteraceae bacterium]|nr:MAG: protein GlmU [Desulfobacteraceae bacterium]
MTQHIKDMLIKKGVTIILPDTVYISEDVSLDAISGNGVTIFPGCRITGDQTLIMDHCNIGKEAPVTLEDCQLGAHCSLNGGFFQHSTFAGHNSFGACAHVRKGCILEEQANAAHSVGLKQTVLFPFVTLGSQINFCDCLMAGGTSRKDHSEVGSSFIHFNFTPNQDKATPCLMGNVHEGVMLNKPPVFLGGQGGMVGPCRIGFGCVTAAGSVIRKDELQENRLIFGASFKEMSLATKPGIYSQVVRIYNSNIHYLAALVTLKAWYCHIRPLFFRQEHAALLLKGMMRNLDICFRERIKRLKDFKEKLLISAGLLKKRSDNKTTSLIVSHESVICAISSHCDSLESSFEGPFDLTADFERFSDAISSEMAQQGIDSESAHISYVETIQALSPETRQSGLQWLSSLHQPILDQCLIPVSNRESSIRKK